MTLRGAYVVEVNSGARTYKVVVDGVELLFERWFASSARNCCGADTAFQLVGEQPRMPVWAAHKADDSNLAFGKRRVLVQALLPYLTRGTVEHDELWLAYLRISSDTMRASELVDKPDHLLHTFERDCLETLGTFSTFLMGGSDCSFTTLGFLACALSLGRTVVLVDREKANAASTLNPGHGIPLVVFFQGKHFEPGFPGTETELNPIDYPSLEEAAWKTVGKGGTVRTAGSGAAAGGVGGLSSGRSAPPLPSISSESAWARGISSSDRESRLAACAIGCAGSIPPDLAPRCHLGLLRRQSLPCRQRRLPRSCDRLGGSRPSVLFPQPLRPLALRRALELTLRVDWHHCGG